MGTAITVEGISKEYRLGLINNGRLYRDFQSWMARLRKKDDPWTKIGEDSKFGKKDQIGRAHV